MYVNYQLLYTLISVHTITTIPYLTHFNDYVLSNSTLSNYHTGYWKERMIPAQAQETIAGSLGYISIACWLCAQLPYVP